jgi:hypothetical protein
MSNIITCDIIIKEVINNKYSDLKPKNYKYINKTSYDNINNDNIIKIINSDMVEINYKLTNEELILLNSDNNFIKIIKIKNSKDFKPEFLRLKHLKKLYVNNKLIYNNVVDTGCCFY